MTLPDPRVPGRYEIAVVCLGNICRSPMAHVVLEDAVDHLDGVRVRSAGTAGWHEGRPMDRRAAATLTAHGYDATQHRARQVEESWFDECDLVLAMDEANLADLRDLVRGGEADASRLRLFRDFDPLAGPGDREVPDPYYGDDDGFEDVLRMVRRTCEALVADLERTLAP